MFDIGFSELLVIAIVALIVIGPQQLPRVARTLGHLFGRMQRYVNDVKADISREMELDELRKMQSSMEDAARSFQSSVNQGVTETESELNKLAQEAQASTDPYAGAPATTEPQSGEAAPGAKPAPQLAEPAPEGKPEPPAKKPA
jgi:sec-independent protein translocase protein TatB